MSKNFKVQCQLEEKNIDAKINKLTELQYYNQKIFHVL